MKWASFAKLSAVALALLLVVSAAGYGITRGLLSDGSKSEPAHGLGAGKIPSSPSGSFVVVATRDIPGGTRIEEDAVTMAELPIEQAEPFAYNHLSAVVGQDAACDIGVGEQITISDIESPACFGTGGYLTPTADPPPRP